MIHSFTAWSLLVWPLTNFLNTSAMLHSTLIFLWHYQLCLQPSWQKHAVISSHFSLFLINTQSLQCSTFCLLLVSQYLHFLNFSPLIVPSTPRIFLFDLFFLHLCYDLQLFMLLSRSNTTTSIVHKCSVPCALVSIYHTTIYSHSQPTIQHCLHRKVLLLTVDLQYNHSIFIHLLTNVKGTSHNLVLSLYSSLNH